MKITKEEVRVQFTTKLDMDIVHNVYYLIWQKLLDKGYEDLYLSHICGSLWELKYYRHKSKRVNTNNVRKLFFWFIKKEEEESEKRCNC